MNDWQKFLTISGLVLGLAMSAQASTLFVANYGVDSPQCGAAGAPCRSISRAITNAAAGDTIIVGPGTYGDLNQNGTWTDPGDEAAEIGFGCSCIVKIDKKLTIVSRDGAATTIIDANGENADVVTILTNNVVFGLPRKGFTLINSGNNGLTISNGSAKVVVADGRATGNSRDGFFIGATAISNAVVGCVANVNGNEGFDVNGWDQYLAGNAATANNRSGFRVAGTNNILTANVTTDNNRDGFEVLAAAQGLILKDNSATSNQRFGILLNTNTTASITLNNLVGNNVNPVNIFGQTSVTNVGLANASGAALDVTNNFFGSATGPGVFPANVVSNFNGSTTSYIPFAKKEIKVKSVNP